MPADLALAFSAFTALLAAMQRDKRKKIQQERRRVQESGVEELVNPSNVPQVTLRTRKGVIKPRGANQQRYVKAILDNDINFAADEFQGLTGTGNPRVAACE